VTCRLKIYQFAHSPFCIAVTQAVRSASIEPELVDVSNADRSAIARLTGGAYYQVPVLADGERIVYESGSDSQDIAAYLDEHYLGGRLFPAHTQGLQMIVIRYLENEVENVTFKVCDAALIPAIADVVERALIIRHKERKFGPGCIERWTQERGNLIAEATRLLCPFEQTLAHGGPFLFGTAPVYSDFLLFGILENFTFRGAAPFPANLPALRAWRKRLTSFRCPGSELIRNE
jgi:glutathione S-transferase